MTINGHAIQSCRRKAKIGGISFQWLVRHRNKMAPRWKAKHSFEYHICPRFNGREMQYTFPLMPPDHARQAVLSPGPGVAAPWGVPHCHLGSATVPPGECLDATWGLPRCHPGTASVPTGDCLGATWVMKATIGVGGCRSLQPPSRFSSLSLIPHTHCQGPPLARAFVSLPFFLFLL